MKIARIDLNSVEKENIVIALGNFDGIHLGHRVLMNKAISRSKEIGAKSAVLLFNDHTTATLDVARKKELTSNAVKWSILEEIGIDIVYMIDFDKSFMQMSPEDFVIKFLKERLSVKGIVVGYDYRFGYKASGTTETLRELTKNFEITLDIVEAYKIDGEVVSATRIRRLIELGEIEEANKLLGRNYFIEGIVNHGKNLGSKMGYPTANIIPKDITQLPIDGVYDTNLMIVGDHHLYKAATSIGNNPTFEGETRKVEANILDFDENIYGKRIIIYFLRKIRPMIVFNSVEDLFVRIAKDVEEVRKRK